MLSLVEAMRRQQVLLAMAGMLPTSVTSYTKGQQHAHSGLLSLS